MDSLEAIRKHNMKFDPKELTQYSKIMCQVTWHLTHWRAARGCAKFGVSGEESATTIYKADSINRCIRN